MNASDIFDLTKTLADKLLQFARYPWDALDMLDEYIMRIGRGLGGGYTRLGRDIWVAKSASVSEGAELRRPLIIGEGCEVSDGAVLGGGVILGRGVYIGDGCELCRSVLFDGARCAHNNYVGHSIIGHNASLLSGAIISVMRSDRGEVICSLGENETPSGHKRFGALVGDSAEIGCSSVLSAGTVVMRGAAIGPLIRAGGFIGSAEYIGERIIGSEIRL